MELCEKISWSFDDEQWDILEKYMGKSEFAILNTDGRYIRHSEMTRVINTSEEFGFLGASAVEQTALVLELIHRTRESNEFDFAGQHLYVIYEDADIIVYTSDTPQEPTGYVEITTPDETRQCKLHGKTQGSRFCNINIWVLMKHFDSYHKDGSHVLNSSLSIDTDIDLDFGIDGCQYFNPSLKRSGYKLLNTDPCHDLVIRQQLSITGDPRVHRGLEREFLSVKDLCELQKGKVVSVSCSIPSDLIKIMGTGFAEEYEKYHCMVFKKKYGSKVHSSYYMGYGLG